MELVEALLSASFERVVGIAAFYGIPQPETTDKCEKRRLLAEAISSHLLVPANAVVAMKGLGQEELVALRLITLAGGGQGVVIEQCHQKLNQLSRKWRRNGAKVIEALISRGLVYTRREGYRQVYFVPKNLAAVLARFFLEDIFKQASVDESRFTPRHRSDFAAPLRHLIMLLSYVRKNEVKVTQNGTMFKKSQNDLLILLDEAETNLDETLFPVRYSPRLALLLYFAKSKNLIEERRGLLRLTQNVDAFLKTPYTSWRQDIFDFWKQTFVSQDTDLQTLLWILMHSPNGMALSMETLLSEMNTLSTTHSSHGLSLRVERNLVEPLEYLGALEVSSAINSSWVKPTDMGRALSGVSSWPEERFDDYLYVQSNFELLVPCTVEPRILWDLDGFAELHKADQMMVYKLTKNSVYRALLHGYTPETIQAFLEQRSKTPVAQNISYSIAHWGTSYGRIEFQEAILLKCDSEELADELMMSPKIKPFLRHRVGPCYIVVDRDTYDLLAQVLSEEGYMPKIEGGKLTPQPS